MAAPTIAKREWGKQIGKKSEIRTENTEKTKGITGGERVGKRKPTAPCNDRKGMKANRVGLNSVLELGLSISTSCSKYCVAWTDESRKEILKPARPIVGQTSCLTVDDSMTSYQERFEVFA